MSANNEDVKMTSTGVAKDPVTGSSAKASDSNPAVNETPAQKAMREAKAKLTSATPAENKATTDKPNPAAVKSPPPTRAEPPTTNKVEAPLEEGITDLNGRLESGSFAIEFRKSGSLIRIPVSMETARDSYTLDNTFKLIKDIQGIRSKKELEEKYASFLPEGV